MDLMRSPPTTATLLSDATIYRAVKDVELLLMPDIEAGQVLAGNQNNLALPNSRDYVVNTIIAHREIGTPVESYAWSEENGMGVQIARLVEVSVQVDVYSDKSEAARMRAETLAMVARSTPACDFFAQYGVSTLYADDARNTTVVVDENQYVQRWTTSLHLTYTHRVRLDVEGFAAVNVGVKNVDVHYPPK